MVAAEMATQAKPIVEPRLPLSRDRVLRAAIGLADVGGIETLSMRKLGQELAVEAMSLYNHVANKDDILGGMVDIVMGEIELPADGAAWRAAIRRTATSAYEVLLAHPWAANLILSGPGLSYARLRYMNGILGSLRKGGFSAEMTDHAYHALDSHIMGFTLWQVGISAGLANISSVEDFLRELDQEAYPHLVEHAQQHMKPRDPNDEGEFVFGLDLILDGLERYLGSASREPRTRRS
jgi:AcrR family transcriptional regulator